MQSARQVPNDVQPGETILAEDINLILALLREVLSIKGEGRIEVVRSGNALVIREAADYRDMVLYRVTGVRVDGTLSATTLGDTVTDEQGLITYDLSPWKAIEHPDLSDVEPTLGRPHANDDLEIQSAPVGAPVRVYTLNRRNGTTRRYIEIIDERIGDPFVCETEE